MLLACCNGDLIPQGSFTVAYCVTDSLNSLIKTKDILETLFRHP